jgi:ATP-dependent Zn protease
VPKKILIERLPQLKARANALLEKETLESDAVQQIVESANVEAETSHTFRNRTSVIKSR